MASDDDRSAGGMPAGGNRYGGFLPPEPPGPEPDLGRRPQQTPPPPEQPAWQPPQQSIQQFPPGYWHPQQTGPPEPDNGPAVAGFVLAMVAAGLMVISVLLLSFICVVLAIFGIVQSRRGKRKVEAGETRKHKGLAQAGYVTNIVVLVIGIPVTLLEIIFLIAYATDDQFREDFQDDWDQEFSTSIVLLMPILKGFARLFA